MLNYKLDSSLSCEKICADIQKLINSKVNKTNDNNSYLLHINIKPITHITDDHILKIEHKQ